MKRIVGYIYLLLAVFLTACTSEDFCNNDSSIVQSDEVTQIKGITSSFTVDDLPSRANVSMGTFPNFGKVTWAAGDTIGIYPTKGDQLSFPIVNGIDTDVCEFNGGGWALKTSTTYTAYTPFNRNYYQYMKNDALPVSMLDQKQIGNNSSKHLGAYDIQVARDEAPANGLISFGFNHQVAFVRMDITAPCKANWKSITLESTAAFTTKAKMNLSSNSISITPTAQANSITLNLQDVSTNDSLHIVAYMMLLPVDLTNKSLNIKLEDSESNIYITPASIVNNVKNFKAGTAKWITSEFEEEDKLDDPTPYVTFKADAEQTLTMSQTVNTLEYSINGGEWMVLGTSTVSFGGNIGDLRLRARRDSGTALNLAYYAQVLFGHDDVWVTCTGDIRTLIDYKYYSTVSTSKASFAHLFRDCKALVTAPNLPSTDLASGCYYYMFSGCSNLIAAPLLPATTLSSHCYTGMFKDCIKLSIVPDLLATTLGQSSYCLMFSNCINLTQAPNIAASTLEMSCCSQMFNQCKKLVKAPILYAKTLHHESYINMFNGCSSLNSVTILATNVNSSFAMHDWLRGTADNGTIIVASGMKATFESLTDVIPDGWEVVEYEE